MTFVDPVCGMTVNPAMARGGQFDHAGTTHYFCSPGCRTKFAADPDGWLARGPAGMSGSPPVLVAVAFSYSVSATIAPRVFPAGFR